MNIQAPFWRSSTGSFTIEAALVAPLVITVLLMFMLAGTYVYQSVIAYYTIASAAERAAWNWDNSYREAKSGVLLVPQYDPLYSSLSSNGVLQSLFQFGSSDRAVVLPIGNYENNDSEPVVKKLQVMAGRLDKTKLGVQGEVFFEPNLLQSKIGVRGSKSGSTLRDGIQVSSSINDPVTIIRNMELFAYYGQKLTDHINLMQFNKKASSVLKKLN